MEEKRKDRCEGQFFHNFKSKVESVVAPQIVFGNTKVNNVVVL